MPPPTIPEPGSRLAAHSPSEQAGRLLLAPRWHTGALVGLFVAVAALGTLLQRAGASGPPVPVVNRVTSVYLPLIATEWGLLLFVWLGGLRLRGTALRDVIGGSWASGRALLIDVGLALAGWTALTLVEVAVRSPAASSGSLLPQGATEKGIWVVVALSAALSEEIVFRGYLQRQFEALFGSAALAIVLQSLLFGLAHAEQGVVAMLKITAYGLGLGLLARARGSLRPGLLCHAWTDLASGLFRI